MLAGKGFQQNRKAITKPKNKREKSFIDEVMQRHQGGISKNFTSRICSKNLCLQYAALTDYHYSLLSSAFALQILFLNDNGHGFVVNFAFQPGDNVKVGKGAGFKAVLFEAFDAL